MYSRQAIEQATLNELENTPGHFATTLCGLIYDIQSDLAEAEGSMTWIRLGLACESESAAEALRVIEEWLDHIHQREAEASWELMEEFRAAV